MTTTKVLGGRPDLRDPTPKDSFSFRMSGTLRLTSLDIPRRSYSEGNPDISAYAPVPEVRAQPVSEYVSNLSFPVWKILLVTIDGKKHRGGAYWRGPLAGSSFGSFLGIGPLNLRSTRVIGGKLGPRHTKGRIWNNRLGVEIHKNFITTLYWKQQRSLLVSDDPQLPVF